MLENGNANYLDSLLLQELQQNDEKALNYLFTTHYNKLYRAGLRWSNDSYITEESIQEVFQDIWKYRHSLSKIQSFEAYLMASLKKRLSRKSEKLEKNNILDFENIHFPVDSYEAQLIERETEIDKKHQLKKAMESLTKRQKEIIKLKYFDELSYQEISIIMNLKVDSIYKLLHESIKVLKIVLSKKD